MANEASPQPIAEDFRPPRNPSGIPRVSPDRVRAVVERFQDTALPNTSRQVVVLQEHDSIPLAHKKSLTSQLLAKLESDDAPASPELARAKAVLTGMDLVEPRTSHSAIPALGVVRISP